MTDFTELKRLAEHHLSLGQAYTVAKPSLLLALIAENDLLRGAHEQICTSYNQVSYASEERGKQIDQLKAELEHNGYDHDLLRNENDQLKAENEALRSDIQSWRLSIEAERNVHKLSLKGVQDELDRLKGPGFAEELATLRKNTARYQWLREARSGYIEVVQWIGPHATGMTGEDLDALLDAVMSKGEQS